MPAVFGFLVFLYGALTVMNWDINYAGYVGKDCVLDFYILNTMGKFVTRHLK